MTLGTKLVTSFLGCGLIPLAVVSFVSYSTADKGMDSIEAYGATDLEKKANDQLIALRDVKKRQIEQYFKERHGDMGVLVQTVKALRQEAFQKLEAVQELKKNEMQKLFARMRTDVASLAASQDLRLMFADFKKYHDEIKATAESGIDVKSDQYKALWEKHKGFLSNYIKTYGYYDAFLICAAHGHVLFTACKESDLGENLGHGQLKEAGLAHVWRKAKETKGVVIDDFEPYAPSKGAQAAFIGAPVLDESGKVVAVVALQMPTDPINAIAQRREGMGKTGETYVVGTADGKVSFRSDMKTMGDGKYVIGYPITTPYIEKALAGTEAQEIYTDSKGNLVMVAYGPLKIEGLNWAMVSKINMEEAIAPHVQGEDKDFFTQYATGYGYHDLFLINPDGKCFYTVCHEADYNTNLIDGKFKDSNLGELVRDILKTGKFGFADFKPYAPSNGEPCAFIAQPIMHDGKPEIIVALQLSLEAINGIMSVRAGMGKTGETYLVGSDKLMRSDSFLDATNHTVAASFKDPSKGAVDTEAARAALGGATDAKIITDYNGNPVLSAYTPIDAFGTRWALLAEIDEAEAMAAVKEMRATASSATTKLLTWVGSLGAIAGVLVALISVVIARSISKPVNRIIAGLNEGADQVNDAAGQVSSASQQLAEGASEQASSLEETSSALEQMAAMARQNADNAQQANTFMSEASRVIGESDGAMKEASSAMQQISEASDQISKIIKVIEEIAFQTNLLALNAAVEAARAGEHGKGFAVVADEVRNLAQRAAQAARETGDLIEQTVNRVARGVELNQTTSDSFAKIGESATKVANLVAQIAQASSEQAQGVEQVNTAVSQMDKVTQSNAAGAEESASAAEEMSAQAENVRAMVNELVALVGGSQESGDNKTVTAGAGKPAKKRSTSAKASVQHFLHDFHKTEPSANAGASAKADSSKDDDLSEF
ncbi:MAG: methyl-accepting chemotaxis protein [Phycisphaerae bacterium]|nr:methyl-accepting chemotaxis protein [Phycisphaerae bacterium]